MESRGYAKKLSFGILSTCFVGFALSYYAYTVETASEKDDKYEAMCDISEHVSCTKAFMSKYGKGFGLVSENSPLNIPNCLYGLVFYAIVGALSFSNNYSACLAIVILGIISNIGTIYLIYILYLLKNICVLCVGTYIVNGILCALAIKKFSTIHGRKGKKD